MCFAEWVPNPSDSQWTTHARGRSAVQVENEVKNKRDAKTRMVLDFHRLRELSTENASKVWSEVLRASAYQKRADNNCAAKQ